MSERPFDDGRLEAALRDLAGAVDWPTAAPVGGPDVAIRVRVRLTERPARRPRFALPAGPLRRALILALAALLALAAVAGAVRLGLPGLRLVLDEPAVTAPPTIRPSATSAPGPVGATLGLGESVAFDDVEAMTGVAPRLPTRLGRPEAVYVDPLKANQVAYVWAASDALPPTRDPGIGLILMQFDGRANSGYHEKLIGEGVTAEPVIVDGQSGFWISGTAHFFYYIDEGGTVIDDGRRWVDDALVWSDGATTYRLETSLGRNAAIQLAESLQP